MGRRRGVFIPLPGGSGALLGSGAQAMPADFLHSTSRASNMALRPPPAVRQDGRSENFGPFRSGSGGREWEEPSALSGDCERSGFFGDARGRLRPPFGRALGRTRLLGKDRRGASQARCGGGAGWRRGPEARSGPPEPSPAAQPPRTMATALEPAVRRALPAGAGGGEARNLTYSGRNRLTRVNRWKGTRCVHLAAFSHCPG
ncbi:unnamed protein product [Nyctereutes procyonoides]|uniref:(raccoon dog) hypothetical protein n=1 Tax=Nyctereutes procyonoides TaxID=34880 RepID=A0A811YP40_NYCPR|nr:unnamed protein product [Nyctereutes procyonoides]